MLILVLSLLLLLQSQIYIIDPVQSGTSIPGKCSFFYTGTVHQIRMFIHWIEGIAAAANYTCKKGVYTHIYDTYRYRYDIYGNDKGLS